MGMYDKLLQEERRPLQTHIPHSDASKAAPPISPRVAEEKPRNVETYEPSNIQNKEPSSLENYKSTNLETYKPRKKVAQSKKKTSKQYNALLTVESIQAIKRLALDEGKKDYEVVQEAIDQYLKKKGF